MRERERERERERGNKDLLKMEVDYERTRDRARSFLAAIDELTLFREQLKGSKGGSAGQGNPASAERESLDVALAVAIERLESKFHEVAGELAQRVKDLGNSESLRIKLKHQAELYSSSGNYSEALKDEIEGEYAASKAPQHYNNENERNDARMVGKMLPSPMPMGMRKRELEPKRLVKRSKEELEREADSQVIRDFSKLSTQELDKGVMNMIIRGLVAPDVDLGDAFDHTFFTTMGITPGSFREQKTAKQMLQDYVDAMVAEEQAPGERMMEVVMGAKKKQELEDERSLKYQNVVAESKKRYSMKFLDANKMLPSKRKSLLNDSDKNAKGNRRQLNELEQFFSHHKTFKKAYTTSMNALGDGYLPILQYKFLKTMPEFRLFKAKNSLNWKKIEAFMPRLCKFCKDRGIFLGAVPWRKLAILSVRSSGSTYIESRDNVSHGSSGSSSGGAVSDYELSSVVVNLYELSKELINQKSAVRIQAAYKGFSVRKRYPRKQIMESIWTIQAHIRKKALRKKFEVLMSERKLKSEKDVRKLQGDFKKNWRQYSHSNRTIIHLPSLSLSQEQRITSEHFLTRQFSQFSRLCDLRNPHVNIIFVSPLAIPPDLLGYFLSILQVRGVKDPKLRLKIIVPENLHRLPGHFSLTQALLASPTAYKRLEIAVQGQRAYLMPMRVGKDEQDLSVALKVPILGPTYGVTRHFSTKAGARQLFASADMNVPPGAEIYPATGLEHARSARFLAATKVSPSKDSARSRQMRTNAEKLMALLSSKQREMAAKLVALVRENPFVRKWVFKVNDEYDSRGIAVLDLRKVDPLKDVSKRVEALLSPQDASSIENVIVLLTGVRAGLEGDEHVTGLLETHVHIHNKEVYPTWDSYVRAFASVGGIIEAYPEWVVGSPSANVYIDPLGNIEILSTHEQIFAKDFTFVGASFPQSSVPHLPLAKATMAIAKRCYEEGIIGYFGIDFVALRQEGFLRLWAVDLNLHTTKTQLTFQFFDFVSGGTFNAESGIYSMPYGISYTDSSNVNNDPSSALAHDGSRRCYVMTDFVSSSRFEGLQLKTFFKDCRNLGLTYDVGECTGTVFHVIDTLSTGVLSIFSAGHTVVDSMKEASRTLSVLARRFGQTVSRGGANENESFHRIYSTLRFIADKLRAPVREFSH